MDPIAGGATKPVSIKVYLVVLDSNVGRPSRILGAKLTKRAAEAMVERYAGSRVEKVFADKA